MSRIFQTNFQKGSLIEETTKEMLTNSGARFVDTGKGMGARTGPNIEKLYFPPNQNISNIFSGGGSVNINFSINSIPGPLYGYLLEKRNFSFTSGFVVFLFNDGKLGFQQILSGGPRTRQTNNSYKTNTDYSFIIDYDSSSPSIAPTIYLLEDGSISTEATTLVGPGTGLSTDDSANGITLGNREVTNLSPFDGVLYDVSLYKGISSIQNRVSIYEKFISRPPLSRQIKDFTYHKPTRSREEGLVLAYNMIPQGNILTDISGNGNDATLTSIVKDNENIRFNLNSEGVVADSPTIQNIFAGGGTVTFTILPENVVPTTYIIDKRGPTFLGGFIVYISGSNIRFGQIFTGTNGFWRGNYTIQNGIEYTISITYDASSSVNVPTFYVNGNIINTISTQSPTGSIAIDVGIDMYMGTNENNTNHYVGKLGDISFYEEIKSNIFLKNFHNNRAKQVMFYENFEYAKADGNISLPISRNTNQGDLKIKEGLILNKLSKYVEGNTSGSIYTFSDSAYGAREFDINVDTQLVVSIITDDTSLNTGNANGYNFTFLGASGTLIMFSVLNGSQSFELISPGSFFERNKWYSMKVERKTNGEFTIYMKGQLLGDEYVLVTNISGTNPLINNNIKKSNYFGFGYNGISGIANIIATKGILLL